MKSIWGACTTWYNVTVQQFICGIKSHIGFGTEWSFGFWWPYQLYSLHKLHFVAEKTEPERPGRIKPVTITTVALSPFLVGISSGRLTQAKLLPSLCLSLYEARRSLREKFPHTPAWHLSLILSVSLPRKFFSYLRPAYVPLCALTNTFFLLKIIITKNDDMYVPQ